MRADQGLTRDLDILCKLTSCTKHTASQEPQPRNLTGEVTVGI